MAVPDAETTWQPDHPVSLELALSPLQRGSGDPTQRRAGDGAWWRTAQTPIGPGTLRLAAGSRAVHAQAWGPGAAWLVESVPGLLGAEDDPSGFVPQHPLIAETARRRPRLRLGSVGLVFELLVPSVLEQRVTGHEARRS